ncbi:hypothetical protein LCGC14_1183330 [marine sediment metagenome]|uniref:Uncharacterized protein n=1 Tax=marine sediment metagenome TaxID=412755 RepID=A0A0F9PRZ7_9ZZZZ
MDNWKKWAIRSNDWRLVPRAALLFYLWVCYSVLIWFMGLDEPTTQQTSFATGVWGAAAGWFGFYCKSGTVRKDDSEV